MLCAAISVKIMAVTIGPAGVGLFSLLRQAQQTLSAVATLGGQDAVMQGVASRQGVDRDQFIVSVLWAFIASSVTLACVAVILAHPLGALIIPTGDAGSAALVRWLAFPVMAGALLVFFRSLLNAHMWIGAVAWTNVVTAASLVVLVCPAVFFYQAGHQMALVLLLGGSLTAGLMFAIQRAWDRGCLSALTRSGIRAFEVPAIKSFLWVGLPSLTALFVQMASLLAVRTLIVRWHGLPAAGLFDSAWSISTLYLAVFLSALQESSQDMLDRAFRLAVIVSTPLIAALIVLKPLALRLLYSSDFLPALELLRWTLIGDYLRVAGWVLATSLVARADMRAYLACEVAWNATFAAIAFWLVQDGVAGAGPAYVAGYAVYLTALVFRTRHHHNYAVTAKTLAFWIGGACIVMLASICTWSDVDVSWPTLGFVIIAAFLSWLTVTPAEKHAVRGRIVRALARKLRESAR
jgi:O-antigen/teichoic acid export membrane protein